MNIDLDRNMNIHFIKQMNIQGITLLKNLKLVVFKHINTLNIQISKHIENLKYLFLNSIEMKCYFSFSSCSDVSFFELFIRSIKIRFLFMGTSSVVNVFLISRKYSSIA